MIVDTRKDSYDELQILAGDVRTRRRRANIVTTALITGGIVGTVAYIAAMNQQVEALAGERDVANIERDTLQVALEAVDDRLADLRAQVYESLAEHVSNIANGRPMNPTGPIIFPSELLINGIPDEIEITGIPDEIRINGELPGTQAELINLVYIVDGSRRFPMTIGDVLWIPEAQFWVRLIAGDPPNGGTITRHDGAELPTRAATGQEITIGPIGNPTEMEISGRPQGATNCISLGLGPVTREGFGFNYFDMDVLVSSKNDCARP
jgi:hypothetical protein